MASASLRISRTMSSIRFVQIGSMANDAIAVPATVLRSLTIEIMGSGIGSVSLQDLIGSIGDMLSVAHSTSLTIATQSVALSSLAVRSTKVCRGWMPPLSSWIRMHMHLSPNKHRQWPSNLLASGGGWTGGPRYQTQLTPFNRNVLGEETWSIGSLAARV